MGEVYLAEDSTLGRKVAIKFLSDEFKGDKEKLDRFIQEAKAASALNHPNIITVFEIGSAEGVDFIATEYIDGRDLNRILAERMLPVEESVDIAIQAASAIKAAHQAGIIHRDIKSDNVMVRNDGIVKVLDFGLAKLTQKTDDNPPDLEGETIARVQTQPGIVMGTPSYMSPEQIRGRDVDHRTDIFSLGVLLYEMLTRARPFDGETTSDIMAAVLTKMPVPLSDVNRTIPAEIEEIVSRALEKEKEKRYQSAAELLKDLTEARQELQVRERLRTTEPPERVATQIFKHRETVETGSFSSVAVLPFTNMSADEENEYFCDGLAEELLGTLSKISDLKVAARSTTFAFKGSGKSAIEIGGALGVQSILDGSVRKSGNRVRITVQLVDASNGYQLWSERFDREMQDIFEVQDEIALSVADALKLQLLGDEREAVLKRYTNNAEAYQLYLRGRFFFYKRTPEGFRKAIEYFERAIALDPEYAIAYSGLADCWLFLGFYEAVTPSEAVEKLTPLVEKALRLDDGLAETRVSSALKLTFYEWDFEAALGEYEKALAINPKYAFGHHLLSSTKMLLGMGDEAIAAESQAAELEPFTAIFSASLGWWLYLNGRTEESVEQALRTIEIAPNHFFAHWVLGLCYARLGRFSEAAASLSSGRTLTDGNQHITAELARVYAMSGKRDEAEKILSELREASASTYISATNLARIYHGLEDREKFLEYIEKAADERSVKLPWLLVEPIFEDFRSEPRFRAVAEKVGVTPSYPPAVDTDRALEAPTVVMRSDTVEEEPDKGSAVSTGPFPLKLLGAGILAALAAFAVLYFGYTYLSAGDRVIDSIAVMPFDNPENDADTEYLTDGMTEALISSLSKLPNLDVKPRSSVFRFKGKEKDAQTVANTLNVQAVLYGRIVKRDEGLTLSLELIDVSRDSVIWSEQYRRNQSDLVSLQSEITRDVSRKLKSRLSGEDTAKIEQTYTENSEAYQFYLKGRYHWNKRTYDDLLKAIEQFKAAIEKDENYALAYAGLADTYSIIPYYQGSRSGDYMRQAKPFAEKAVELNENLAESHTALAFVSEGLWNWAEAEKHYKRAIEINPGYSTAQMRFGRFEIRALNRGTQALTRMKRAVELEPASLVANDNLSQIYLALGDANAAAEQARRTTALDPQFAFGWIDLAFAGLGKGRPLEAIEAAKKTVEISGGTSRSLSCLGYAYAVAGKRDDAVSIAKELEERFRVDRADATEVAAVYAGLGDKDQAFAWLDKAFAARSSLLVDLRAEYPFAALRDDPRYLNLLKRMDLPR